MKTQLKGFVSGVVITLLVLGFAVPAFAAYQKQATLNYDGIKISLNGKTITPKDAAGKAVEPFIIDAPLLSSVIKTCYHATVVLMRIHK